MGPSGLTRRASSKEYRSADWTTDYRVVDPTDDILEFALDDL
jgi:hypothetical protein